MSRFAFKLPDLGEGTVEAEIVAWHVKPGDTVAEDDVIVEVMTEKAAVEVPSPVGGRVISTRGTPGEMVPVGSELIVFETEAGVAQPDSGARPAPAQRSAHPAANDARTPAPAATAERTGRVATSPAIRRLAHEAGIDLTQLTGTGPNGRIVRKDLDAVVSGHAAPQVPPPQGTPRRRATGTEEIRVIGVRRLIAQRMSDSKRNIPHFTYVEEVDVTELESLREYLNHRHPQPAALTYLPFIVTALTAVLRDYPQCNALYDAERGVIVRHHPVHVGIATQTSDGLKVPVVRHAESLGLRELAARMREVSEAARANKATREQLSGSTITVTSLGKLGGIVSTPIINAPEVCILGINRAVERPVVHQGAIAVRRMVNLSSSFDHRFVDGHDAAAMIQAMKERLEHPATIFLDD